MAQRCEGGPWHQTICALDGLCLTGYTLCTDLPSTHLAFVADCPMQPPVHAPGRRLHTVSSIAEWISSGSSSAIDSCVVQLAGSGPGCTLGSRCHPSLCSRCSNEPLPARPSCPWVYAAHCSQPACGLLRCCRGDGTGGESIYGEKFADENFKWVLGQGLLKERAASAFPQGRQGSARGEGSCSSSLPAGSSGLS